MSPDELTARAVAAHGDADRHDRRARVWLAVAFVTTASWLSILGLMHLVNQADHEEQVRASLAATAERQQLLASVADVLTEIQDCTTEGGECFELAEARSAQVVQEILVGIETLIGGLEVALDGLDEVALHNAALLAQAAEMRAVNAALAQELALSQEQQHAIAAEVAAIADAVRRGAEPPVPSGVLCDLLGADLGAGLGC